jgi:DNA uptake protein ComE-like DNA-binding protein
MKSLFGERLKEWFGYTRRERRASFILLIVIAAVAGARFVVPGSEMPVEIIAYGAPVSDTVKTIPGVSGVSFSGNSEVIKRLPQRSVIDLNRCDSAMLEKLPGIGPVLSARIIKYRNLLGGYAFVDQLKEVYGLSAETYELIKTRLTADSLMVSKIDINGADFRRLVRMPYLDRYEVNAILKYRELRGRINSINELSDNKLVASEKIPKIRPYMEYGE